MDKENCGFHLSIRLSFTIFVEDRRRLGIVKFEKLCFHLALLSPFAIFA